MTETMTEVIVSCPSCARPMDYLDPHWQCLACKPVSASIPICKTQVCKRPLTKLGEPWNCWICLTCNKHPDVVNKMKKQDDKRESKYIDKPMTEERVKEIAGRGMTAEDIRQIVRETFSEFSTKEGADPDYPPTHAEIQTMTAPENVNAGPDWTWLQKAKSLGVKTHKETGGLRKKSEIIADMEAKERAEVE